MTVPSGRKARPPLYCSFCGKPDHEVKKLISGPNAVFICDECVEACADIIAQGMTQMHAGDLGGELIIPAASLTHPKGGAETMGDEIDDRVRVMPRDGAPPHPLNVGSGGNFPVTNAPTTRR